MTEQATVEALPVLPYIPLFQLVEDCRYGRFLVPPTDIYVGQALVQYGEYSQIEVELLLQFLPPGSRAVVVGANLGATVIPIARHAGEVVTFEPQRWVYQLLCANLALNDLLNVRAYWAACGAHHSQIPVAVMDPSQRNNFGGYDLEAFAHMGGDTVPVVTLDSVPGVNHPATTLLTIDVEGMELDVLRGADQTIATCRPVIFFEADRAMKRSAVFAWLRERNYSLSWYRSPLFNPQNHRGKAEDIWSEEGKVIVAENVIAVPQERGIVMNGFTPVLDL